MGGWVCVSVCMCFTKQTIIVHIVPADASVPWVLTTGLQISGRSTDAVSMPTHNTQHTLAELNWIPTALVVAPQTKVRAFEYFQ